MAASEREKPSEMSAGPVVDSWVDVAVPLPLPAPLTYGVPPAFTGAARPGARVRVTVGRRSLTGIIIGHRDKPPENIEIKPLVAVLDREPILSEELLAIGRFLADYYLAPPGEALRALLPADLPPWGDRKIWLTDAGALSLPRDDREEAILDVLRREGRITLARLQTELGGPPAAGLLESLEKNGRVVVGEGRRQGTRYENAVELTSESLEALFEKCGRSEPGRRVIRYLAESGRPATVAEVRAAADCGAGVIRRLAELGVLRRFSQISRLPLDHHRLSAPEEKVIELRDDQAAALRTLSEAVAADSYRAFLLAGMTGSGKTEVYLRAASETLERGRSAVVLVPEIALVPALARAARARFGRRTAILHSGLSRSERHQEWERIRGGEATFVLGPRSAVFAPVRDLGLLVVDEEQDSSYKQDKAPRYNGRDLALWRGREANAVVVTVSATPSLETRHNVELGKMERLELTQRVGQGKLPEGILVDLRESGRPGRPGEVRFSDRLREELEATFAAGDQAILLRNRRGYAPILLCRACGEDFRCDDCGLPRTLHLREGRLLCHYCGSTLPAPKTCPGCARETLEPVGSGTERIEEKFRELYPDVSVDVLDRDTARRPGGLRTILDRFAAGETRVLVGTQMVSKGHHFPNVSLTAVLLADTYLAFPDFRGVERTYNLLTQIAGRAGRGDRPGRFVIQTYQPQHYAIQAALAHDDARFAQEEMRFRRIFHYPPFTRMVQLMVRDRSRKRAEAAIGEIADALHAHPLIRGLRILGPAPAPLERLRGRWRYQLVLRGPSGARIRRLLGQVLPATRASSGLRGRGPDLVVDVDPQELL